MLVLSLDKNFPVLLFAEYIINFISIHKTSPESSCTMCKYHKQSSLNKKPINTIFPFVPFIFLCIKPDVIRLSCRVRLNIVNRIVGVIALIVC